MNMPVRRVFCILLFFFLGCNKDAPAPSPLKAITTRIGAETFILEVADTEPARQTGLMNRKSMPDNHGMLFVFPDEQKRAFWMKNTLIPLDILFVSSSFHVVSIKQMKPLDETSVPSNVPARYAIELNAGAAARAGAKVGDYISIPPAAQRASR
jgi:uncharacterized protein